MEGDVTHLSAPFTQVRLLRSVWITKSLSGNPKWPNLLGSIPTFQWFAYRISKTPEKLVPQLVVPFSVPIVLSVDGMIIRTPDSKPNVDSKSWQKIKNRRLVSYSIYDIKNLCWTRGMYLEYISLSPLRYDLCAILEILVFCEGHFCTFIAIARIARITLPLFAVQPVLEHSQGPAISVVFSTVLKQWATWCKINSLRRNSTVVTHFHVSLERFWMPRRNKLDK